MAAIDKLEEILEKTTHHTDISAEDKAEIIQIISLLLEWGEDNLLSLLSKMLPPE